MITFSKVRAQLRVVLLWAAWRLTFAFYRCDNAAQRLCDIIRPRTYSIKSRISDVIAITFWWGPECRSDSLQHTCLEVATGLVSRLKNELLAEGGGGGIVVKDLSRKDRGLN